MDNRERDLFEACLRLTSPEAREAFLRDAVAGDTELERRVRRLLAAHERTEGLQGVPKLPEVEPPAPPERIGPYRVLDRIGEGGMGVVYLGEQAQPVRRRVAIKVLKAGVGSREVLARFEAERQALALMSHPNVARIIYADVTERGQPYFVMDYVAGVPITRYANEGKLPIQDRIRLFLQVCSAARHAHQKGIIHRDLKPSNILVSSEGGEALARVIDFGIAKATHQPLTDRTLYTRVGQALGTPEYMSPEQADDSIADVDTRSDVYSLGVVLYELLTGTRPFDFRGKSLASVQRTLNEAKPLPPSEAVVRASDEACTARRTTRSELRTRLRGDMDAIILKALAKEPARRYPSVDRFADDIINFLERRPVTAQPDSLAYRGSRFVRRHRPTVVASGLLAASLVGGLFAAMWQADRAREQAVIASDARDEARAALNVSREMSDFLIGLFDTPASRSDRASKRALLEAGAARVEGYRSRPEMQALVLSALSEAYSRMTEFEEGERHARRALAIARTSRPEGSAVEANALLALSLVHYGRRAHDSAWVVLAGARELVDQHVEPSDPLALKVLSMQATTATSFGRYEESVEQRRAIVDVLRSLDPDHPDIPGQLADIGSSQRRGGQVAEAEQTLRYAADFTQRVPGVDPALALRVRLELADLLFEHGIDLDEAEGIYRAALADGERIFGTESPVLIRSLNDLAQLLASKGMTEEPDRLVRRSTRIVEAERGPQSVAFANQMGIVARVYLWSGRHELGFRAFDEAIRAKLAIDANPPAAGSLREVGRFAVSIGEFERAESYARQLEALFQGPERGSRYAPFAAHLWGELYSALGRYEEAEAALLGGLALAEARPDAPIFVNDLLRVLVRLYEEWGRPEAAADARTRLGDAVSSVAIPPPSSTREGR